MRSRIILSHDILFVSTPQSAAAAAESASGKRRKTAAADPRPGFVVVAEILGNLFFSLLEKKPLPKTISGNIRNATTLLESSFSSSTKGQKKQPSTPAGTDRVSLGYPVDLRL